MMNREVVAKQHMTPCDILACPDLASIPGLQDNMANKLG